MVDINGMSELNGQSLLNSMAARPGQMFAWIIGIIGVAAHLALGADPLVVCLSVLTVLVGIYPLWRYGFLNIGALLVLLVMFRYVGFPLIGKLLFLQPLDSNLDQPLGAFAVVLIGVSAYTGAFITLSRLNVRRTMLKPVTDPRQLRRISMLAMVIGCTANFAVAWHAGRDYPGTTVATFFVPFLDLALIAAIAAVVYESSGKRSWNFRVLVIVAAEVAFALVRNSRIALVGVILCYVFTLTAFQGKARWGRISLAAVVVLLFVIAATPVMLFVRTARSSLTWTQRITATLEAAADWRNALDYYNALQLHQKERNFYLTYYGSSQNILERMSLINHVDVIKSGTDKHHRVGLNDLKIALERALPRLMVPDKPMGYSQGDWLYCAVNVRCHYGTYATVPLIAGGYAALGWPGVILYPILFGSAVLLVLRIVSGFELSSNIWAIYFFIRSHNGFVEGSSATYMQSILRDLPQDTVLLLVMAVLSAATSYGNRGRGIEIKS